MYGKGTFFIRYKQGKRFKEGKNLSTIM